MLQRLGSIAVAVVSLLLGDTYGPQDLAVVAPVVQCESLVDLELVDIGGEGSRVRSAVIEISDGVEFCVVLGRLAPQIQFEVILPTTTWTQRYMQVGCGGLCGNITLRAGASSGCQILENGGFAMAATDMGHGGMMGDQDGSWALNDQQRADFAYRAQHVVSKTAKKLIAKYYGQAPTFSYFNGCSDGGREALMEAERFPEDFDGIIAGAPAMNFLVQNTFYHAWQGLSNTNKRGEYILMSKKLPAIHQGVLDACDEDDGVKDGLVSQPALCKFDPNDILCDDPEEGSIDNITCLTTHEAQVVQKLYAGPQDPITGANLTAGQPEYGSELEWEGVYVPESQESTLMYMNIVPPLLKYLAFDPARPDMEVTDLEFTEATLTDLRPRHPLYDSVMADLSAFQRCGGKLIMWHGMADPHISPSNTLTLHKKMLSLMGKDVVESFERLYLLPGVAHCGSGQGPSDIDLVTAMLSWVESGHAPDAILTSSTESISKFGSPSPDENEPSSESDNKHNGQRGSFGAPSSLPPMTRPVYPWPYVASFKGQGDLYNASSWTRGAAAEIIPTRHWAGDDFFGAYTFIDE